MDANLYDVIEIVSPYLDQLDKVSCTSLTKAFKKVFDQPHMWERLEVDGLSQDVQDKIAQCAPALDDLSIIHDDTAALEDFFGGSFLPALERLNVYISDDDLTTECLDAIAIACPNLRNLELLVETNDLKHYNHIDVPAFPKMQRFELNDVELRCIVEFAEGFQAEIPFLRAASTNYTGHIGRYETHWDYVTGEPDGSEFPTADEFSIIEDEEESISTDIHLAFVPKARIKAKTLGVNFQRPHCYIHIDAATLDMLNVDELMLENVNLAMLNMSVDAFFTYFFGPRATIALDVYDAVHIMPAGDDGEPEDEVPFEFVGPGPDYTFTFSNDDVEMPAFVMEKNVRSLQLENRGQRTTTYFCGVDIDEFYERFYSENKTSQLKMTPVTQALYISQSIPGLGM